MKKILLVIFVSLKLFSCEHHNKQVSGDFALHVVQANGLTFITDPEKVALGPHERAVFPYEDESSILLTLAKKITDVRKKPFDTIVDSFCGDGKSGLPMLLEGIGEKLIARDNNPRAIQYATLNASLNHLEKKCDIATGDVYEGVPKPSQNTLWIANPPAEDLQLTLHFAKTAYQTAHAGDVIIGLSYSRTHVSGKIELEEELRKVISHAKVTLLQGEKIWRGFDGKKEQPNPMPLSGETFALKANPYNPREIEHYRLEAKAHNDAGYTQLGYFSYMIEKS